MSYQSFFQQVRLQISPMEIVAIGTNLPVSPLELMTQGQIIYTQPTSSEVRQHKVLNNYLYPSVTPYHPPHGSIKPQITQIYNGPQRHVHGQRKKPNKGLVSIRHDRLRKTKIGFTKYSSMF